MLAALNKTKQSLINLRVHIRRPPIDTIGISRNLELAHIHLVKHSQVDRVALLEQRTQLLVRLGELGVLLFRERFILIREMRAAAPAKGLVEHVTPKAVSANVLLLPSEDDLILAGVDPNIGSLSPLHVNRDREITRFFLWESKKGSNLPAGTCCSYIP